MYQSLWGKSRKSISLDARRSINLKRFKEIVLGLPYGFLYPTTMGSAANYCIHPVRVTIHDINSRITLLAPIRFTSLLERVHIRV